MKIENSIDPLKPDPISGTVARTDVLSKKSTTRSDEVEKVDISSASRTLVKGGDGDIRADKVAQIRQAIAEGRFEVDARRVAAQMITEAAQLLETMATKPMR